MDMPRKYIANIAVMFGIRPGRMGKKKLTKAIFQKMERMEEQSRREAMKPTPEIIKRLGEPYGAPWASLPAWEQRKKKNTRTPAVLWHRQWKRPWTIYDAGMLGA